MVFKSSNTNDLTTEESDFDLHGIVGIRCLNAKPSDIATIKRQVGPIQKPLSRTPDITIRFVDRIPLSSTVRYLGVDDVGFTDDAFLVLRGKQKAHVKVHIPFDQIGSDHCEIICETGLPAVPLLIPVINLTVLSRGALPLHASAFNYNQKGILVTGWAKGGKTEMLLAFAAKGAEYVGDEWVYISKDGECMFGIPEPIRIWYWHLQEMPQYRATVKRNDLIRLKVLNFFVQLLEKRDSGRAASARFMRRVAAILKQQLYVQLPPEKLFGHTASNLSGRPEILFFVGSHADPRLTVDPIEPQEVARRIGFSLQEERKDFMSYYWKYRFAFPDKINPLIEAAEEIQQRILLNVLTGKETYAVFHPYPVSIPALFEVSDPYCSKKG